MRYIAITEDELLTELMASPDLEEDSVIFVTADANFKKWITRRGGEALSGDLGSPRVYERAGVDEDSLVIVHLHDIEQLRLAVGAVRAVESSVPVVVLATRSDGLGMDGLREEIQDLEVIQLQQSFHDSLQRELKKAVARKMVSAYRSDFSEAERVLILVHSEPDPDSLGSALALRTLLGRDRRTAIIGTPGTFTRPENVQMAELLDIQVQKVTKDDLESYQRIALVDAQANLFDDLVSRVGVDLVIDHHPVRREHESRFQDIRPRYGATATILVEHLHSAGVAISERLATALLYAIKTDTLFLQRNTTYADVEAFTEMYRQADRMAIRKIEGAGGSLGHLDYISKAIRARKQHSGLHYAHVGRVEREDYIPWLAEFFLELQEVDWVAVSGVLGKDLILSMRNLGYQRSVGKLVKKLFDEIGSAGGHRSAAKAVIPLKKVRELAGSARSGDISAWLWELLRGQV